MARIPDRLDARSVAYFPVLYAFAECNDHSCALMAARAAAHWRAEVLLLPVDVAEAYSSNIELEEELPALRRWDWVVLRGFESLRSALRLEGRLDSKSQPSTTSPNPLNESKPEVSTEGL